MTRTTERKQRKEVVEPHNPSLAQQLVSLESMKMSIDQPMEYEKELYDI